MTFVSQYTDKQSGTKQKLQSGTISKVLTQHFTQEELEYLWKTHDATLKELKWPGETYSRNLSDLIRSFRDISQNLILSGAIHDVSEQCDVASVKEKIMVFQNLAQFFHGSRTTLNGGKVNGTSFVISI